MAIWEFSTTFWTEIRRLLSALCFSPPHTHPPGSHPSLEGTVAPLPGHSTGVPGALVLFSTAPLLGCPFLPGALLHPAGHSSTPILSPGLLSVLKAFLLQTQIVTWNKFISAVPMKMGRVDIPKGVMENSPGLKEETGWQGLDGRWTLKTWCVPINWAWAKRLGGTKKWTGATKQSH